MTEKSIDNKIGCPFINGEDCFEDIKNCNENYKECSIYQSRVNQYLSRLSLITQYGSDLNGDTE